MSSKRGLYIASFLLIILISLVSAGLFGDLFKESGKASEGYQDVSVVVAGTNPPQFDQPSAGIGNIDPVDGGLRAVNFQIIVTDLDGVANINDASLSAEVSRGATTRAASCINPTNIDSDTRSYDCTINMQYYDEAGTWDFYAEIQDQETNNGTANVVPYFTYNLLMAMDVPLSPATLSWSSLTPGASDQLSNNDPTVVTNTGNYAGNIFIEAYNLQGETTPIENIPASAFSVDSATGGAECAVGTTAVALGPADGTLVDTGIYANPGAGGFANIYYCLDVPYVSSQAYSTSTRGPAFAWVVSYV